MTTIFDKPGELVRDGVIQSDSHSPVKLIRMRKINDNEELKFNYQTSINGVVIEISPKDQPEVSNQSYFFLISVLKKARMHRQLEWSKNSVRLRIGWILKLEQKSQFEPCLNLDS